MTPENKKTAGTGFIIAGVLWMSGFATSLVLYLLGSPDEGNLMKQPLFLAAMVLVGGALIWYGRKLRPITDKDFE